MKTESSTRGLIALTAGNAAIVVTGYVVTVSLARLLQPEGFGAYGAASAILSLLMILMGRGVSIAAGREIAAHPLRMASVSKIASTMQLLVGALVTTLLVIIAPWLAELMGDKSLRVPLLISAFAGITYALHGIAQARTHGAGKFGLQSRGQFTHSLSRMVLIVGGAYFWGLDGAIIGWVLSPLPAALAMLTRLEDTASEDKSEPPITLRKLLVEAWPVTLASFVIAAILAIDLIVFKIVGEAAAAGVFMASITIARIPYVLLNSTGFTMVQAVVSATDSIQKQRVMQRVMGDTLTLLAWPTLALVVVGDRILPLVYGEGYEVNGPTVSLLALASAALTIHVGLSAIDIAHRRMKFAICISIMTALGVGILVAYFGAAHQESGAALGVFAACVSGALIHLCFAWRKYGRPFAMRPALTTIILAGVCSALLRSAPNNLVVVVFCGLVLSGVYLMLARRLHLIGQKR